MVLKAPVFIPALPSVAPSISESVEAPVQAPVFTPIFTPALPSVAPSIAPSVDMELFAPQQYNGRSGGGSQRILYLEDSNANRYDRIEQQMY